MDKITGIKEAIRNGVNRQSKLDDLAFGVGSFTSPAIRHILNNLGAISTKQVEVGLHIGGTFIAANYNNNLESYGIDNWSQFNNNGHTKDDCINNCKRLLKNNYTIIEKDCFKITDEIPGGIDFYCFDGGHDETSQHDALTYFKPYMADEFIFCVDDSSWQSVREGTNNGIKDAGLTILHDWFLWDGLESGQFWNGFSIFLLKK